MKLNDVKANKRPVTRTEDAFNHLRGFFGPMRAHDITSDKVTEYITYRQAEGAANATINRELSGLKRSFRLGERAGKVTHRPYISMLVEDNVRKGFLEPEQIQAVLKHLPNI